MIDKELVKQRIEDLELSIPTLEKEIPVMCKETGKKFKSLQEASKYYGFFESSISQSIRKGYSCYGYHFVKLEENIIWQK